MLSPSRKTERTINVENEAGKASTTKHRTAIFVSKDH
jgi:hypothetical protein